ncbi:unnamed protein product [Durusdinium trenchii]|uniref:DUF4116 domain-containing protein n=1 Tax=Durusdinium trenchii TaxID=1381693 RepID=A0ABP0J6X9_9DINO
MQQASNEKMKWLHEVEENGLALKDAPTKFRNDKDIVLAALKQKGLSGMALVFASERLKGDRDIVLAAVKQYGKALQFATPDLQNDREIVMTAVLENGIALRFASENIRSDREFLLQAVKATKASWLLNFCPKLKGDEELCNEIDRLAGTGLVFTYYQSYNCSAEMRESFVATGASVPGGPAYQYVMEKLREKTGGTATVWFDEMPVFGFSADNGEWVHPSEECGRDLVPVPPPEGRHPMWNCLVESRSKKVQAEVGSHHPCWCCHWLREVKRRREEGAVICCAVSNIYLPFWVDDYGAGSSELSDAAADKYGLKRESFRNGRPPGWGEGEINIDGKRFSRVAPMHPDTLKPLGEGCRWERQALDGLNFPVYVFFYAVKGP